MTDMSDIIKVMYDTAKKVCDKVYLQNRPASTTSRSEKFIVVELPSMITNNEISQDGSYNDYSTTGQFTIFVRDRASSKNSNEVSILTASDMVNSLKKTFSCKGC